MDNYVNKGSLTRILVFIVIIALSISAMQVLTMIQDHGSGGSTLPETQLADPGVPTQTAESTNGVDN